MESRVGTALALFFAAGYVKLFFIPSGCAYAFLVLEGTEPVRNRTII
jgi:hypothetical protein